MKRPIEAKITVQLNDGTNGMLTQSFNNVICEAEDVDIRKFGAALAMLGPEYSTLDNVFETITYEIG